MTIQTTAKMIGGGEPTHAPAENHDRLARMTGNH
jgi:hypothetical protein